jgi:hypothetical protein
MVKYNIGPYLERRYLIKCGGALEWQSETALGKSIRLVTGYNVNHVSQVITFKDFYEDKPIRIYTLEALSHGIELNLLSRRLEEFKGKVYWLPLKDKYFSYNNEISRLGLERIGLPYDFNSIKKILFKVIFFGSHNIRSNLDKLFCSEYVFYNGKDAGLPVIDKFKKTVPVPGEMMLTEWYKVKVLIHNTEDEEKSNI